MKIQWAIHSVIPVTLEYLKNYKPALNKEYLRVKLLESNCLFEVVLYLLYLGKIVAVI